MKRVEMIEKLRSELDQDLHFIKMNYHKNFDSFLKELKTEIEKE